VIDYVTNHDKQTNNVAVTCWRATRARRVVGLGLGSPSSCPDAHLSFTPGRICLSPKLRIGVAPAWMGQSDNCFDYFNVALDMGCCTGCIARHNGRGYRRLVLRRVSSILHCFSLTMIDTARHTAPLCLYHLRWTRTASAQRCIAQRSPPSAASRSPAFCSH